MGKATRKAIALGALMALFGKAGKAQEVQAVMPKQAVKENMRDGDISPVSTSDKRKIVQFSDAKNWFDFEPQFFCSYGSGAETYVQIDDEAIILGGIKSSNFKFSPWGKISFRMPLNSEYWDRSGLVSTVLLYNFYSSITPHEGLLRLVHDFYYYTDFKIDENKSIELKVGKFSPLNYWEAFSNCIPTSIEYLNTLNLNAEYRLPEGAMVSFHDKKFSVGFGAGFDNVEFAKINMTWHKFNQWLFYGNANCNIVAYGEYTGEFFKIGAVFRYNFWQLYKDFPQDKINGAVQFVVTPNEKHSVVFEINNYGYNYKLSGHLLYSWVFAPNMRVSCDVYKQMYKNGGFDADGVAVSLWYTKLGLYGCVGFGPDPNHLLIWPTFPGNLYWFFETGMKIPLSTLTQNLLGDGKKR